MPAPDSPVEPAPDQPVVTLPGSNGSAPDAPSADGPASDELTTDEPTPDEPTTDEPTTDGPASGERSSGGSVIPLEPLAEAVVPTSSSAEVAGPVPALDAPGTLVDRLDDRVDAWFDRVRGQKAVDRLMYTTTELADFSLLWHLIGAARGATARDVDRGFVETARLASVLGAESLLVNGVLKGLFKRQRPVPEFERPLHLRVPLTSSFPSGHASAAFCSAAILSQTSRGGKLWYGVAALVASSRVYVKIHHPSDVMAGAAVGLTMGVIARRLWPVGRRR